MRKRKKSGEYAEIDMAPLIDMVFLLLIFFMCSATMSQVDLTPDVALPVAPRAQVPDDMRDRGTVSILPDNTFMISGSIVSEKELIECMKQKVKQNSEIKLYLRADKSVPFIQVKKVLRACADTGISDVVFASFQSENM